MKSSPGDLKIAPTLEVGVREAEALRRTGADMVVAVVHTPRSIDRALFESRAFDLILTGDDHELAVTYDGRTAMMESLAQADFIAAVDITLDKGEADGRPNVSWRPDFRVIDTADVEPDPDLLERIAAFEAELSAELDRVIGTTEVELDSRRSTVRHGEALIGNIIADAMREAVGAEVALMNSGGIRADRLYPAGSEITRRDILAELPFGDRVVKIEVTGEVLRQALENGFSRTEDGEGRFPQVSGMAVEADLTAPAGSRVRSVTVNGAPLDPAGTYVMATNEFIVRGGDGYAVLTDAPRILDERDGPLLASAVMAYIRKRGEIAPALEGRIKTSG